MEMQHNFLFFLFQHPMLLISPYPNTSLLSVDIQPKSLYTCVFHHLAKGVLHRVIEENIAALKDNIVYTNFKQGSIMKTNI